MLHNGSADLRSPEKEVYFRSWDFANSQMCEVREAAAQEADVIRANVVAKGAERISPQRLRV